MTRSASIPPQPSCADATDPGALPVEEARRGILQLLTAVECPQKVALRVALGRVLAQDVLSTADVPAHDNSAMDGYAVSARDLPASGTRALQVVGSAWAGKPFTATVQPGEAVRIMTGAVVPAGCDAVVMQEQAECDGEQLRIGNGHRPGQNIRRAGEDLSKGQVALARGHRMQPADLGLLASLGISEVHVQRPLRVAFFSTGDELRSIGEPLETGQIYDSNRYTLFGMLTRLGVDIIDMGVVRDKPEAIRDAFVRAAANADCVITSGGVSVGDADYVKQVLDEVGEISFWKIAMKPGRPLAFGRIGAAGFFGLPGNPVAVMVTFYQFVQPALRHMAGETEVTLPQFTVPCLSRLKKRAGRSEFQRGILSRDAQGQWVVRKTGGQGSGVLSSMSSANCFIVLPPQGMEIEPGDPVLVEPFHALV
ncbi:MAG: molybdopterin molybdenumtransferase MoeA [Thiogranum sp.]|jgi:molybdopterin molybdotransferase|nr:molybdopterin molybdenumtransferase MoeA [Thiogranum sp.]